MQELCCQGDLPFVIWVLPRLALGAPLQRLGASPGWVVLGVMGKGLGRGRAGCAGLLSYR